MNEKSAHVGLAENGSMRFAVLSTGVLSEVTELDVEEVAAVEENEDDIGIGGYGALSCIVGVARERVEANGCEVIREVRLESRRGSASLLSWWALGLASGDDFDPFRRGMKLNSLSLFRVLVGDEGGSGTGVREPEDVLAGKGPAESIDQRDESSASAASSKDWAVGNVCERSICWHAPTW